jgi:putative transposase
MPVVADVPGVPSAEELSALPAAELAARLAEAYRLIVEPSAQNERLAARVGQLERQARKDSSTSSRPPSSDSPYKKKGADRSLRDRGKRRPGKQPGSPGATMNLVDDPDERFEFPPAACRGCGAGLAGAPVLAQRRHQVTDIAPAPAPKVTEYVAQARECLCCGTVTEGKLPAHVRARASFGPETCAQAANLTAGHYIPVYRATLLLCQLAGVAVSTGWMAGTRGRAAALVEASGFMDRVRELLKTARNVLAKVPAGMQAEIKDAYWKLFETEDLTTEPGPKLVELVDHRITEMADRYSATYPAAMKCLLADREGLTAYLRFPAEHHHRIRHSNFIERTFGETRRRVKVIGRLPGETSCLTLVWAVLDRASRGWRGLTMTAGGLRLLQDLRRSLLDAPRQLRPRTAAASRDDDHPGNVSAIA